MITPEFVVASYKAILNRAPENTEIINHWCCSDLSESDFIYALKNSKELLVRDSRVLIEEALVDQSKRKNKFLMIQTSDPTRYKDMLFESSKFNSVYATNWGWDYSFFIGLKVGCYPLHAMFNRIFLLSELIDSGFKGWVMYLDADCVITNPSYDVKEILSKQGGSKSFFFLNHHRIGEDDYRIWYVNSGFFLANLSSEFTRGVIKIWREIYTKHSNNFYSKFSKWGDIYNDQDSLHDILKSFDNINDLIIEGYLYDSFVTQFGRLEEDPSDQDISARIERIRSAGFNSYGCLFPEPVPTSARSSL